MKDSLREILNTIDEVLAKQDELSGQLWNVLTGLRGPDHTSWKEAYEEKHRATVPIRRAAFPKTAALEDNNIADFGVNPEDSIYHVGSDESSLSWHFDNHSDAAARALDIFPRWAGPVYETH